jgi:hypothetical protein
MPMNPDPSKSELLMTRLGAAILAALFLGLAIVSVQLRGLYSWQCALFGSGAVVFFLFAFVFPAKFRVAFFRLGL